METIKKPVQKRWFHATTKECWKKIKKEKILFGFGDYGRCTFLARNMKELIKMIYLPIFTDLRKCEMILSVRYTPDMINDNYDPKSWEMIVKKSIPIENVKVIKYLK